MTYKFDDDKICGTFCQKIPSSQKITRVQEEPENTPAKEAFRGATSHATLAGCVCGPKQVVATTPGFTACFWKVISVQVQPDLMP